MAAVSTLKEPTGKRAGGRGREKRGRMCSVEGRVGQHPGLCRKLVWETKTTGVMEGGSLTSDSQPDTRLPGPVRREDSYAAHGTLHFRDKKTWERKRLFWGRATLPFAPTLLA